MQLLGEPLANIQAGGPVQELRQVPFEGALRLLAQQPQPQQEPEPATE